MGKLKRNVCEAESVCLLWRGRVWSFAEFYRFVARGGGRTKVSACPAQCFFRSRPARVGRRMNLCAKYGVLFPTYGIFEINITCRMFRCWGGAVPRGGVCKTGEAPARGAARSAAGGRRRRPKAGDAFRGGVTRPVPLTQNLRGKHRTSPERLPAERVLPAPRAGERTLSAFLQRENPLRSGIGTFCTKHRIPQFFTSVFPGLLARHNDSSASRPARVLSHRFSKNTPRALLEIKNNRFRLCKHSVSTSPLPLTLAFLQPSAFRERSDSPRPDLPTQSGRADTRFPREPRSPAPASDEAVNFCETSNALPP